MEYYYDDIDYTDYIGECSHEWVVGPGKPGEPEYMLYCKYCGLEYSKDRSV